MSRSRLQVLAFCLAVAVALALSSTAGAAAAPQTPQRAVAEQWVYAFSRGDQRAACELQFAQEGAGQSCGLLPVEESPVKCPKAGPGAKPNFRKKELRTEAEQVGEFTAEGPTRGFFKVYAEIKAKKLWGALGLEQEASGSWGVTYLRYADETFAPAGTSYQSEASHKLWLGRGSQCRTDHPQWEQKD